MAVRIFRMKPVMRLGRTILSSPTASELEDGIASIRLHHYAPRPNTWPIWTGGYYQRNNRLRILVTQGCVALQSQQMSDEGVAIGGLVVEGVGPQTMIVVEPNTAFRLIFDIPISIILMDSSPIADDDLKYYMGFGDYPHPSLRAMFALREMGLISEPLPDREGYYPFNHEIPGSLDVVTQTIHVGDAYLDYEDLTLGATILSVATLTGVRL